MATGDERVARIKRAATLLYGEGNDGEPRAGWKSAMARDLDVRPSTIAEALTRDQVWSVFDRRLGEKILSDLIARKESEISELSILAEKLKTKPSDTTVYGLSEMNELLEQTGNKLTPMAEIEAGIAERRKEERKKK